jgi:small subunit ribosomal protein S4
MTKRIKSKFRVCKKIHGLYKNLWGVQKAAHFRSVKIFKQNIFAVKQKQNRLTAFGRYLNTKQIIKHFYCNISEQNFQNYINKSIISKATCLVKLFSLLESRIDAILYRSCLVNSLYMSRQLLSHKLVFLNGKCITYLSKTVSSSDLISLNPSKKYLSSKLIEVLRTRRLKQYFIVSIKMLNNIKLASLRNEIKALTTNNRLFTASFQKIFIRKFNFFLRLKKLKSIELIPNYLEVNFKVFKIVFLWEPTYKHIHYPVKIEYKKQLKGKILSLNNLLYKY